MEAGLRIAPAAWVDQSARHMFSGVIDIEVLLSSQEGSGYACNDACTDGCGVSRSCARRLREVEDE